MPSTDNAGAPAPGAISPDSWPVYSTRPTPIGELLPYARNARTHSDEQVAQLAALIQEFGWTMPILADEAGEIIAGHGRILAAHLLGLAEVPVADAKGWSEEQKRAYRIADNRLAELSVWDDDLLKIELEELRDLGADLSLTAFTQSELDAVFDGWAENSGLIERHGAHAEGITSMIKVHVAKDTKSEAEKVIREALTAAGVVFEL